MRNGFITGDWTVSPSRNLLTRGEEQVRVEPRVMDVLVLLTEQADQVVSKEDLIARVWPDRHVTDDVLTVTIYALRKALGDEARRPRYVETVSRRGYRWIAPITAANGTKPSSAVAPAADSIPLDAASQLPLKPTRTRTRGLALAIAAAAALVALCAAGLWWIAAPRKHHVATPEAHEAYLKGRYFLDQRSISSWQQALDQFKRAVTLDPRDPAAHAGLADAYSAMWDFGVATRDEMRPQALKAAQEALTLDAQSAEGHEALGRAQFLFDWDFDAAEASLTQALARDPDYMPAHQAMAWVMSARGRYGPAVAAARRALQIDPVNTARYNELAWVLALSGDREGALREVDRALQLNPRSFEAHLMKGWICELAGRPDEAFAAYRNGLRLTGAPDDALQRLSDVYRAEGLPGYYRRWLERSGGPPMSDTLRAQLYVRVGQLDQAMQSLERAYARREGALAWVNVEPSFAALHADARFQQIAAHVPRRD
jgi:DNA-binding winged helix-turn-helix (wHTH) protein/Tfp pilus assembly protein PilF